MDVQADPIVQMMIQQASERVKAKTTTRDCLMKIADITGPVSDAGGVTGAFNVLAYYAGGANSAHGQGLAGSGATAFADVLVIIEYAAAIPGSLLPKMTAKGGTSIKQVDLLFRGTGGTTSSISLSGDGSTTSVWPSRCDVIRLSNDGGPYVLLGFSYDLITWIYGQSKFAWSLNNNASGSPASLLS